MNDIKLRQLCFIFAAMLPVTRMIVYPATLAYHAGSDLLLSAALSLALEGLVVGLMLWLARRTRRTFFGLLAETFGDAAARIVYGLFALFFALSALLPLLEQRGFVMQVLYENVPPLICYAPFFGVCFFACTKGLRAVGRVADLSLPVFALSYAVVILLALPQADFGALLPVVESGARVWRGFAAGPCWYTACLYPLFFLGHVRYERRAAAKVLGSYAASAAATLLFLAVFYAVFSDISILQHNSLAQISKYATAFSSLGRADLLFIFALTLVLAFALCIPVQLSVHCAARALGCCPLLPAAVINAALLALTVFFNTSFREVQQFCTQRLWFDAQRAHVREMVAKEGFELREHVKLGTLPKYRFLKNQETSEITGEGELRLDREGLHFEGVNGGAPYSFFVPIRHLPTYGMCTDVSRFYTFVDGEFNEFYPERESAELWMMATEEMHRAQGGLWKDFPVQR